MLDLDELSGQLDLLRTESDPAPTVVHCHGVFDLLHIGHVRYLEAAAKLGDILVVTITPDEFVNKGPNRPAFPAELRAEHVAALGCVTWASVNRWPTAIEPIARLKPDLYVKGSEYRNEDGDVSGAITREREAVEAVGGRLTFTDDIVFSSSNLLNRFMPQLPSGTQRWLDGFNERHGIDAVTAAFERARPIKLLVVGETIVDEYLHCEAIGKSSKEPTLAVKAGKRERFAGGILAVANNAAACCDQVNVITQLGDRDPQRAFCREHLQPNVHPTFLTRTDAPTIVKRRYIDTYFQSKLFEVYHVNDAPIEKQDNEAFLDVLRPAVADADAVLVVDFGHGLMSAEAIELLCDSASFLAVNVQANAGNLGFNLIGKYPRADLLCVAQNELRLEFRDKTGDLHNLLEAAGQKLGTSAAICTRGKHGALTWSKTHGRSHLPAVAAKVVDRVGAGDTFLSILTPVLAAGAPLEVACFLASVAGAEAVATVGHRQSLDRVALLKHATTLLK
ncbi:MAG: PfkB family carbohydrate kinase [Planctomycetota bacterium]